MAVRTAIPPAQPRRSRSLCAAAAATLCASAAVASAQQLIGYVPQKDATVSGTPDVLEGRAVLVNSASVTAKDHTAPIALARGGTIRICQTSVLHLTEGRAAPGAGQVAAPLLLALDRGAVEIEMQATPTDALLTPDLRVSVAAPGPLDLRLRVASNGDTCVENRGAHAPVLALSDPFGESAYQLNPGQHVLFEHGSLKEVVDRETTACGCPAPGMSVAEALLAPGKGQTTPATAAHPFPEAQSAGLAPGPELAKSPPAGAHPAASDALIYNAAPQPADTAPAAVAAPVPSDQPAPAGKPHRGVFKSIGHFFAHIFGA